jgi:ATP-dependent RNA helicase RhlE
LALAPTRELAIQIEENFRKYGKHMGLNMALLYGGVKYGKQLEELRNNPDIVVATPGRLLDHIQQGNLSLCKIEILILDEVDRMLDMGFVEDVTKIINKTPRSRQTLLFSATIPDAVVRLSKWALDNPAEAKIDIKISAAETVTHALYPVPAIQKFDLLIALLRKIEFESLIIFFQTRRGTDKISHWLTEHGQDVRVLHADLKQRDRMSALQDFKDGKVKILSATDVASRGLDISNVTHVINYDVPQHSEDYVHRIGRTGRAKTEGEAFTLCKPEELPMVESIEKLLGNPLPRKFVDDFAYRDAPETLVPKGAVVSKKRNRSFGKQVSFGSRRRR